MSPVILSRRAAVTGAVTVAALAGSAAAQAAEKPPAMRRGYADGPYGQIHYRIVAPTRPARTPLLCLHPSPHSGFVYEPWLLEMGKDRIAVAPDTPGYGGSDAPPAPIQITDFAAAMIAFMDAMKLPVVDVMGYHTGSLTSVELARRYPKRIRKVVTISAPNYTDAERAAARQRVSTPPPPFEQLLDGTLNGWRTSGKGLFRDMPDERYYDLSLERMRRYRTSNWGFRAAYNYDVAQALTEVAQPLLILNPEDDIYKTTPRVKPYIRNGGIKDLPGWTHGHLDIHTVEMADIVREFLDKG